MKVVVAYLDWDGYEVYREEYDFKDVKGELRKVVEDMLRKGVKVHQMGDRIVEVF